MATALGGQRLVRQAIQKNKPMLYYNISISVSFSRFHVFHWSTSNSYESHAIAFARPFNIWLPQVGFIAVLFLMGSYLDLPSAVLNLLNHL